MNDHGFSDPPLPGRVAGDIVDGLESDQTDRVMASLRKTLTNVADSEREETLDQLKTQWPEITEESWTELLGESSSGDTTIFSGVKISDEELTPASMRDALARHLPSIADRFEFRRLLGRGGMGAVYEVHDLARSETVAMKVLLGASPDLLMMFKQEFRGVAAFSHPNLVTLFDFYHGNEFACLTMELIEGQDIVSHLRANPSRAKTQDALQQLATGVSHLHSLDRLHRDLKPSNIQVTPNGSVVILDFGLLTTRAANLIPVPAPVMAGTIPYMAPELHQGHLPSFASDWFAVGVILFEILTGTRPDQLGPDLDSHLREADPTLAEICLALLDPDSSSRGGGELLAGKLVKATHHQFVGREAELETLHEAFQSSLTSGPGITFVEGESGIGKSALCQRLIEQVSDLQNVLVFSGRCYERESIPYKAVDEVIDQLAIHLSTLADSVLATIIPDQASYLRQIFPVLNRCKSIRRLPPPEDPATSPSVVRRLALLALRRIITAITSRIPLLIYIDDIQWGDSESLTVLETILHAPAGSPVHLLVSHRKDLGKATDAISAFQDRLQEFDVPLTHLSVEALPPSVSRILCEDLIAGDENAARISQIAEASAGNPFLLQELARSNFQWTGEISIPDLLRDRFDSLTPVERNFLEIIAVSLRPIRRCDAASAAGLLGEETKVESNLRALNITKSSGPDWKDVIEPYHDKIRESVTDSLAPSRFRSLNATLANTLESSGNSDPESLAVHFAAAGSRVKASSYFITAAENADRQLAFESAASFYQQALENSDESEADLNSLRIRAADSFSNAGRGKKAAALYHQSMEFAEAAEIARLERRAVHEYLISGYIEEARVGLESMMQRNGLTMKPNGKSASVAGAGKRTKLFLRGLKIKEIPQEKITQADLELLETYWAVSLGFGLSDSMRVDDLLAEGLRQSLRIGDPDQAIRFLAMDATHTGAAGNHTRILTRSRLKEARKLAARHPSPYSEGIVALGSSAAAYMDGRMTEARDFGARSCQVFHESCPGAIWERDAADTYSLLPLVPLADFILLEEEADGIARDAEQRGDLHLATSVKCYPLPWVHLAKDQPNLAEECARESIGKWCADTFHFQNVVAWVARIDVALYRQDGQSALDLIEASWPDFVESGFVFVQHPRLLLRFAEARAHLLSGSSISRTARKRIGKLSRLLFLEFHPWSMAFSRIIRASLALSEGRAERARRLLEKAHSFFAPAGIQLYALPLEMALAHLAADSDQFFSTSQIFAEKGVASPERMMSALIPNLPT